MLSDYLLEDEEAHYVTYNDLMIIIQHLLKYREKIRFCDMYYEKYRNAINTTIINRKYIHFIYIFLSISYKKLK